MEFDQKEETPFNIPEKKKTNKKTLAIYIGAGLITISSLIYGYASYQATYFKDLEIKNLKAQLDDANTKLQRIDILENQVKDYTAKISTLEAKLAELNKTKGSGSGGGGDEASKVKLGQFEASVKKLTHDLTELRGQLGETKKEANKLRQEKTALQNQLDKMKKEAEKNSKKGGQAA